VGRSRARARAQRGVITKAVPSIERGNRTSVPQKTFGLLDALQMATGRTPYGDLQLFPRDPRDDNAFGPSAPLPSEPLDRAAPGSGQPAPRVWQYPVSWNLPGNGNREVPWQVLRASAGAVDVIRQCIEVRKRGMRGLKWRWGVSSQAIQDAYASDPRAGKEDAEQTLREKYAGEIARLTEFWERPWKSNGWKFGQWINAVMEEIIVLDALPIYPRRALAGNVMDLEVLDGSTIKPLLDVQGRRPLAPFAAFQQILYGFPRGEYRAVGAEADELGNIVNLPGGLSSAELVYHVENTRTHSPYGLSQVENALISARLYLKRQGWMLAEYEDGSTPLTWIGPPENPALAEKFTPTVRREWEDGLNAELSGNTRRRARAKVLPPGWTATQTQSVDERYKPEYDIHLIKLVCGHLGVPISELGYSEAKGLGTSGYHEGMANVAAKVGDRPDVAVLTELILDLSRDLLDAPRELEFQFIDPAADDAATLNTVQDLQFKRGAITLNDQRRAIGMALYDFPEADMPMIVGAGPQGVIFLEGLHDQVAAQNQMALLTQSSTIQQGADEASAAADEAQAAPEEGDESGDAAPADDVEKAIMPDEAERRRAEIQAFRRWHRRVGPGTPARPFAFKYCEPADMDYLAELPKLATFDGWIWVADEDLELFLEADLIKGDGWRKLARDSRGRWMKLSSISDVALGPDKPAKDVLDMLRREARRRTHGRKHPATAEGAHAAVRDLVADEARGDDFVKLHAVRGRMTGTHAEQTAALTAAHERGLITMEPYPNRNSLSSEDHAAAVPLGGEPRHMAAQVPLDVQRGTPESPAGRAFGTLSENAGWADDKPRASRVSRAPKAAEVRPSAAEHLSAIRGMSSREEIRSYLEGIKSKAELRSIIDERDKGAEFPLKHSATAAQIRADLLRQEGVRLDSDALRNSRASDSSYRSLADHPAAVVRGSGSGLTDTAVEHGSTGGALAAGSREGVREAARALGGTPYQDVSAADVLGRIPGTKKQRVALLERMFQDRDINLTAEDTVDPAELMARVRSGDPSVRLRISEYRPASDKSVEADQGKA